jgi:hypothetical protein
MAPPRYRRVRIGGGLTPHRVGLDFLHQLTHETVSAQQMAAKLFDELGETRLALSACRILMRLRHRGTHGQEVTNEQRQRLDLDGLVALQALELAREPVQPLGDRRLTLVARIGR